MSLPRRTHQRWREGDFVKIAIGDGRTCCGRVLEDPLMAFYDFCGTDISDLAKLLDSKILFKVWVKKLAITNGLWPIIGNVPLSPELREPQLFYKQDAISKELTIYGGGKEVAATREECRVLERAAVWDPEHIVDRLRDHFDGRSNKWVESMNARLG